MARELLAGPSIITATVILETEWVLRSVYRWPRNVIADALAGIINLPRATVFPPDIDWAVEQYRQAGDFADLTHLVVSKGASAFVTFDRAMANAVCPASPIPIEILA